MDSYDPLVAPEAADWLALDEDVRITLVAEYHQQHAIELPNEIVHATFHAVVENQLAMQDHPVVDALARLMRQGLDRHDSIHAIASVLAEHFHSMLQKEQSGSVNHAPYYNRLRKLTAKRWLKGKG
jgi:hypothetical protein